MQIQPMTQYTIKCPPKEIQKKIREHLSYDETSGFVKVLKPYAKKAAGDVVGSRMYRKDGAPKHMEIRFFGYRLKIHHVAFFLKMRWWPTKMVDHANNNPFDNRWENLRHATASENAISRGVCRRNRLGIKGVSHYKTRKGDVYRVRVGGTEVGKYSNLRAAIIAYNAFVLDNYGKFAHVNRVCN